MDTTVVDKGLVAFLLAWLVSALVCAGNHTKAAGL